MRAILVVLAACSNAPRMVAAPDASAAPDATDAALAIDSGTPDAAGPLDPMTALQQLPGLCTPDEWCWAFPTPTGNRYYKVFGTGADNIWLLGARGVFLQWNGHVWTAHHPPVLLGQELTQSPQAIYGRAANDMWLIIGSAVEHWNGVAWTIFDSGPTNIAIYFHSVWAAPNGDVFTSGVAGLKRSRNGGPFVSMYSGTNMTAVWGTSATDVFFNANNGIVHYDGQSFSTSSPAASPAGFYQGTANDVWGGGNNTLLHWDGVAWTPIATGLSASAFLIGAGYLAANDVWWFTPFSTQGPSFVHWDGTAITTTPIDVASYGPDCCASVNDVEIIDGAWWIVGRSGAVYTKIGPGAVKPIISPFNQATSIWGTSDHDMYFSAGGPIRIASEVRHWDGVAMTVMPFTLGQITGVAGSGIGGANELFSVSARLATATDEYVFSGYHFDGATWTIQELSRSPGSGYDFDPDSRRLGSAYAMRAGEAMVVGQHGMAFHFKAGSWTAVDTGMTENLNDVWGPDPDHLWVTGDHGTLLQWTSANPGVMTPDPSLPATTDDLGSIHGAGGVMWIANTSRVFTTLVRKHTTAGWSLVDANLQVAQLFAIDGANVLATSYQQGQIARWNGTEFAIEDFGYETPMYTVFRPPGGHTWISDGHGVIRHP